MLSKDLLYQLSLCDVPHIGPVHARILAEHFDTALDIFNARYNELASMEGIGQVRAASIKNFRNFHRAEKEITFIEKYGIAPMYIRDKKLSAAVVALL